jgi:hypothetical protein
VGTPPLELWFIDCQWHIMYSLLFDRRRDRTEILWDHNERNRLKVARRFPRSTTFLMFHVDAIGPAQLYASTTRSWSFTTRNMGLLTMSTCHIYFVGYSSLFLDQFMEPFWARGCCHVRRLELVEIQKVEKSVQ